MLKVKYLQILFLGVLVFLYGCQKSEDSVVVETIDIAPKIYIGATGQSYPNSFKLNGKLVGYDVEVAEAIAAELGLEIEWATAEFSGIMGQLGSGRLDTIANVVAITEARSKQYNFTTPYSYLGSQVVTHINNENINKHEDLHGKTVSGVLGSNHASVLQKAFPNGEVILRTYETRDGALTDLISERVDGYINSKPILLAEIKRNNLPLKLVGEPLAFERVGFPFNKDAKGEELYHKFNATLGKLRENGTLKSLSEKYFGEDISQP